MSILESPELRFLDLRTEFILLMFRYVSGSYRHVRIRQIKYYIVPLFTVHFPRRATCFTHFILLDFNSLITFCGFQIRSSSLHDFFNSVTSSILGPNILLSTLFLNTSVKERPGFTPKPDKKLNYNSLPLMSFSALILMPCFLALLTLE